MQFAVSKCIFLMYFFAQLCCVLTGNNLKLILNYKSYNIIDWKSICVIVLHNTDNLKSLFAIVLLNADDLSHYLSLYCLVS